LFGVLAILAGLFSVVTGLLGLLAAKFKKCCFTLPFMIFAVIMSIVMLIVTLIALIGQSSDDLVTDIFCMGKDQPPIVVDGESYANLKEFMMQNYGGSVDKYMCTPLCPCDQTHKSQFEMKEPVQFEVKPEPKYRV